jgi:hypothetical protein
MAPAEAEIANLLDNLQAKTTLKVVWPFATITSLG